MFSLTLMDFTVLESIGNGKNYTPTTKNTSHWFYCKQKVFRKKGQREAWIEQYSFLYKKEISRIYFL